MADDDIKKSYKFPKGLADCVKRLAVLRGLQERMAAEAKPVDDEESALCDFLLENFKKTDLDGMRAHGLQISVKTSTVPTMKDFLKFLKFAIKKGNEDLLQRSVNSPAWRERLKAGIKVPGVDSFDRISLSVLKVKAKSK